MLFNSYVFIGAFLPIVLAGYTLLGQAGFHRLAQLWLTLASFVFYGWWRAADIPILLVSIAFNFLLGRGLGEAHRAGHIARGPLLALGVSANLILLGYFKYAAFILNNVAALTGIDFAIQALVLPLGISFFTFTQIAYLADAASGDAGEYNFIDYCLFVTFFPHLIAGPLLHHREMMTQFAIPARERLGARGFALGITFFSIGLFKKVAIADRLAPLANEAFGASAEGLAMSAAWKARAHRLRTTGIRSQPTT